MHLFIVRHGQCEYAADGPLTSEGELRSRQVALRLKRSAITHILSSPLLRSLGTASIIAEECDKAVAVWHSLREGFDDPHVGFPRSELMRRFPRALLPPTITDQGWPHGGDSYESFIARSQAVMSQLKAEFSDDDRVVMVAHGGITNYLLHAILQIPRTAPQWFALDYCAITHVHFVPEAERQNWPLYPPFEVEIISVNDRSHLVTPSQ